MNPISSNAPTATGAITSPPKRIALNTTESRASTPGSNHTRNASSSNSTATRSITRSTRIVANAAVALRPSFRASRYGRITSPARAGNTADAANPITVVRNTLRNFVGPNGPSRYCQRSARIRNVRAVSAIDKAMKSARADRTAVHTFARSAFLRKIAMRPTARPMTMTVRMMLRKPLSILHDVWLQRRTQSVALTGGARTTFDVLITSRDAFTM